MATLRALAIVALCSCDRIQGFGGPVPPLATFEVTAGGTLTPPPSAGGANLQIALVWGRQWLVEPMCLEGLDGVIPIDSRDDPVAVKALLQAGCRDPFGFVPAVVATSVPAVLGEPITFDLQALPGTDLMVGDLTARVAYGSLVVYDDNNADGTLNLARPNRPPEDDGPPRDDLPTEVSDVVYGASLVAMTVPDQRITYREGAFVPSAFYPRAGCGDPPPGFSVDAASGFTVQSAISATIAGTLPQESDLSACAQARAAPISIALPPALPPGLALDVPELACSERSTDSTVRYREPDVTSPDLTGRTVACVHYPSFGAPSDVTEFVVSGAPIDSCVGLTHYILKGCREGPDCGTPDWDHSLAPPSWWPCH